MAEVKLLSLHIPKIEREITKENFLFRSFPARRKSVFLIPNIFYDFLSHAKNDFSAI